MNGVRLCSGLDRDELDCAMPTRTIEAAADDDEDAEEKTQAAVNFLPGQDAGTVSMMATLLYTIAGGGDCKMFNYCYWYVRIFNRVSENHASSELI